MAHAADAALAVPSPEAVPADQVADPVATYRLELYHFAVAIVAFAIGAATAVMQALSRADIDLPMRSEKLYYLSVTAHGVLMSLVFTTFFIMGMGYLFVRRCLGHLAWNGLAWASWWIAMVGTGMTTVAILSGSSTVLYTFYPPLQAHWSFYVGATLLVVGSWGWCAVMIRSLVEWRREHEGTPVPLAVHGMIVTAVVWILATSGLAVEVLTMLVPWSLGLIDKIDPVIARTWFWWFGHPLTYFWLVPAYVIWYTIMPRHIGGKLFSDQLTRVVFVMFILFSTPVGFHHQFTDPGIEASWKMVHTITTYMILFPSLVTAFTVIASFEVAGRLKGKKGLFDWLGVLPWKDPFFSSVALAMICFAIGGFGGAINAAYAMNAMVHNTAWIHGHFHLTVGTAVALSFMGLCYWMIPRLLGRELTFPKVAAVQPYLWFLGMMLFGVVNHYTGILGMPRRVYSGKFLDSKVAEAWEVPTLISAWGGVVLFVSSACFLAVIVGTLFMGKRIEAPTIEFAVPLEPPERTNIWDRFGFWMLIAAVLIVAAYAIPIYHLYTTPNFPSPGYKPF
ncbi:MAG: cbb3-type cytochrome c oxidase subunit I [Holophagales bacterium]|nr:cbb3-type cytochrome c oxidase subunit I [Holophagales bacterium]